MFDLRTSRPTVEPEILHRQMMQESGGNPNAVSPKGARGLRQIMPATAIDPGFGVRPPRDDSPAENDRAGIEYMAAMKKRYGNTETALIAYNWGPGNADKWIAGGSDFNKLPAETQNYVAKIIPAGFDLKSAKPTFDINTAKPTPQSSKTQTYYRQETGKTIDAPLGLEGKALEYLDDTQNGGKPKGNFFGYIDVGNPMDIPKGYVRGIISTAADLATLDKPLVEKELAVIDSASRKFSAWDLLTQFRPLSAEGRMAEIRVSEKFGGSLTFEKEKALLQDRLSKMNEIRMDIDPVMKGMGLGVGSDGETETLLSMTGSAGQQIASLVGLQRITGDAKLFSAVMAAATKSSSYEQARQAGVGIEDSGTSSNLRAALQLATEYVGGETLSRVVSGSSVFKRVLKGWVTEGAEEGANQVGDILISNGYDITDIGVNEGVFQTLLAAGVGAISTTPLSVMMRSDPPALNQTAKSLNMSPEDTLKMIEIMENSVQEDGVLKDSINGAISQAINDEAGGIRSQDRAEEEAKVQKIVQDLRAMNIPKVEVVDHSLHIPEDFRNFSQTYEPTYNGLQKSVSDYVRKKGEETGAEHFIAIDKNGRVSDYIQGSNDRIYITPELSSRFDNVEEDMELHHNHPVDLGMSPLDIGFLGRPGVKEVVAHLPNGKISSVKLTESMNQEMLGLSGKDRQLILKDVAIDTFEYSKDLLSQEMGTEIARGDQLSQVHNEIFNTAMAQVGITDYVYDDNHNSIVPENVWNSTLEKTKLKIIERLGQYGYRLSTPGVRSSGRSKGVSRDTESGAMAASKRQRAPGINNASQAGGGNQGPPSDSGRITTPEDPEPDREADYAAVAEQRPRGSFGSDAGGILKDIHSLSADAFVPVSTRLGKINERLKHAVRQFVFKTGLYTHEDRVKIQPFVDKVSNKMSEGDYRILDLALKNRDTVKVDELLNKYGLTEEYKAVREVLDKLHAQVVDVGIDVGYIEDYFPRKVKDGKAGEYIAFMRGQEVWSDIKQAMKEADPGETMTPEEQADFVNNYLRGYANSNLQLRKSGHTKARTVDYITPEFNAFYEDSMPTLLRYVAGIRHGIESRKLFGKSESETEDNIGAYVLTLIEQEIIKPEQELELRKLLKAVVEPTGTRGAVSWAKNATYIYLMGNPVSAITQIQDLAFSLHKNGYFGTTVSLVKSLTGNAVLTKEDIGLDNILQEFEDETRSGAAVRAVFRAVGLAWMDNVGKQIYMDAAYRRLTNAAKKNQAAFNEKLEIIFGEEAEQARKDLASGTMSENVKYLIFSELSDVQPISLAEMPVGYLRGGNGRIAYMLKTYTIKQIDIYRREIFDKLGRTSLKDNAEGMKNLISLAAALMLMGMGSDALKDLILGRPIVLDDLVMDNIVKTMGFTKYQIYKAKDDGIANTFFMTMVVPPVGAPIDDAGKDIAKIGFGKKELKDSELLGRVPVVGKFYYWWWGGGRTKIEKDQNKSGSKNKKRKAFNE